jgi:hypothetical protein
MSSHAGLVKCACVILLLEIQKRRVSFVHIDRPAFRLCCVAGMFRPLCSPALLPPAFHPVRVNILFTVEICTIAKLECSNLFEIDELANVCLLDECMAIPGQHLRRLLCTIPVLQILHVIAHNEPPFKSN